MTALVAMVEYNTLQKCEQPWPGLHNPKPDADALPRAHDTRRKPSAKEDKAEKIKGAAKVKPKPPGRKKGVAVRKGKAAKTDRKSRSQSQRQQDSQPIVNEVKVENPAPPPDPPAEPYQPPSNISPERGSYSGESVVSAASTQWMEHFKREKETEMEAALALQKQTLMDAHAEHMKHLSSEVLSIELELKDAESKGATHEALYNEARSARDEWKGMVLNLLPERGSR